MLQDRSKRIATADGRIARLILVTDRELAGAVIALMILLVLVFPNKKLFEELLSRSPDDALSIAYLENLLRSDQTNMDWRLLLAGAQIEHISFNELESLLQPIWLQGNEEQKLRARQIRLHGVGIAYQRGTTVLPENEIDKLLQQVLTDSKTITQLVRLANSAIFLDRREMVLNVYRQMAQISPKNYRKHLLAAADQSLGLGRYRLAADLYFLARQQAPLEQARRYFHLAIGALMADNRYTEALREAERHLGDLKRDAETLRFLIRTARAADSSATAANYARMLLDLGTTQ